MKKSGNFADQYAELCLSSASSEQKVVRHCCEVVTSPCSKSGLASKREASFKHPLKA